MASILKIAEDKRFKLLYKLNQELREPVGTTAFDLLADRDFDRNATTKLGGSPVTFSVRANAGASIRAAGAVVEELWGAGQPLEAPEDHSLAEIHLAAGFGIGTEDLLPSSPFDASVAATSEFTYSHLLPVEATSTRVAALRKAAKQAGPLLRKLDLDDVAQRDGVHIYRSGFQVDLALELQSGNEVAWEPALELFDDLEPQHLRLHMATMIRAGVGASIADEARIVIGASPDKRGWVRARIERNSRRRFSVSAGVDLRVGYDLATPLEAIFDYALGLDLTAEVLEVLEHVATLKSQAGWNRLRKKLEGDLGDAVAQFVEDSGWREWLFESDELDELIAFSRSFVEAYEQFDGEVKRRIQRLWADLLKFGRLGEDQPIGKALRRVAALDPQHVDFDALLGQESGQVVELVETLAGDSLEQLLLGDEPEKVLEQIRDVAAAVLKHAETTERKWLKKFDALKDRTRIEEVSEFLKTNASSKQQLERAIDRKVQPSVRRLASKLVGKVWDKIDDDDLAKVQAWAGKVDTFLANRDELEADLRGRIRELRGSFGFSLSLELERVLERSALLDLEVRASDAKSRRALILGLESGDLPGLLEQLPEPDDDGDGDWMIREGLFSERRVRTGTFSLLSNRGRGKRRSSSRLHSSSIRVQRKGGDRGTRVAEYVGGCSRRLEFRGEGRSSEASVRWVGLAEGSGVRLSEPYALVGDEMRAEFVRIDSKTLPQEVAALETLLTDLGFAAAGSKPIAERVVRQLEAEAAADGQTMSAATELPQLDAHFAIEVRMPSAAVDQLLDDDLFARSGVAVWDRDMRNAAHRFYAEPLITEEVLPQKVQRGAAIAALLREPTFRSCWPADKDERLLISRLQRSFPNAHVVLRVDGRPVTFPLLTRRGAVWFLHPTFESLGSLTRRRKRGRKRLKAAAQARRLAVHHGPTLPAGFRAGHEEFRQAARKISRGLRSLSSIRWWSNPAFLPWLVLARSLDAPEVLENTSGVATFRWRLRADESYRTHIWRLENGITDLGQLFPFRD